MAELVQLKVEPRKTIGSQKSRQMRRAGHLPAIVYGHKEAAVSLTLSREDFEKALRHGARLVELTENGKAEQALIQDVQWDHLGKDVVHVDFRRVSKDERVVVSVPIHLRGTAPGVGAGGQLDQPLHSINIECLVTAVPDHIRVNIAELQIGNMIHVRDLVLPPDTKAVADPDAIVVHVTAPKAEVEATPGEVAEPEVIGRKAATEEEASE